MNVRRKSGMLILSLLVSISCLWAQPTLEQPDLKKRGPVTITVLGTTDIHGNIWGYSYEDNKETTKDGLARVATYVGQVRKDQGADNVVLVDDGDLFQGTLLTDDLYNKDDSVPHPLMEAMNDLHYDAMVFGNHEFNFGVPFVERLKKEAKAPYLCANATYHDTGKPLAAPYTIIMKDGVRIGIIGLTNPDVPRWDGPKVESLDFEEVGSAARRACDQLKGKVDLIVAVAHVGFLAEYDEDHGTDAGYRILDQCPEIKVLMVGHAHVTVNEDYANGAKVLSCKNSGKEVARWDISFDDQNQIIGIKGEVVSMDGVKPSEALRSLPAVKEAHEKTVTYVQGGAKNADGSVTSGVLGIATADFQPASEIPGIPQAKLEDTAVMDLILNVQLRNSGADVTSTALFRDDSAIYAGPINYGVIFKIYKFDNTLYTVDVTGAELKTYMEWAAACYNQWKPGDVTISFNPDKPGYLHDQFQGVNYEIDLSQPVGSRIKHVTFKGQPLKDDQVLKLAVNNYRYSSGLKTLKMVQAKRDWESPNSIRDMLTTYIKEQGEISPQCDHNWKIVGVDLQLDNPERAKAIELVKEGKIELPYHKSLNLDELKAQGLL